MPQLARAGRTDLGYIGGPDLTWGENGIGDDGSSSSGAARAGSRGGHRRSGCQAFEGNGESQNALV